MHVATAPAATQLRLDFTDPLIARAADHGLTLERRGTSYVFTDFPRGDACVGSAAAARAYLDKHYAQGGKTR